MGENDDKVFLKRFSGIIAGLVIVTIMIIIIAVGYDNEDPNSNPSKAKLAMERVTPVAGVRTELPKTTTGPVTVEVADNVQLQPAETAPAASAGIDGSAIYAAACGFCHVSGAAGAPIPGSDAWAERVAKGADALTASAIAGIGAMPAKGGRPDLSDDDIKAAVAHMLAQ